MQYYLCIKVVDMYCYYFTAQTTQTTYTKPVRNYTRRACCTSTSQFHQRCHCEGKVSACKDACDADASCKGYVDAGSGNCQIATTSYSCPNTRGLQDCSLYDQGHIDDLNPRGTCGNGYGGCFIKQSRESFC